MEDALIGSLLDGKYRIEKVLGQGGMAKVYLATQEPLGRKVAVKVLKHLSPDPSVREIDEKRFFREASLASKLTHPNTVIIHDYGTLGEDKGLFLVMEYLDGTSLGCLLGRVGHLSWEAAYPIIKQIGGSLDEAHSKGLIHRDLKPLNIMVSQKVGSPVYAKVLDFGLAKPMKESDDEQVTVKGTIIGSPLYMSPEQIFNEDVDHRSDIYSLGILAFEMLTGQTPFTLNKDGHVRDLLKSHLTGAVPEMRSINPHLDAPSEVEFAIRRCLAKKSKERFDSVHEFIESLSTIQARYKPGSVHATADFTHHHLRAERAGSSETTVSEENVAFSTTRVGSDDEVHAPEKLQVPWSMTRRLIAVAAVLALGIGVTVALSSGDTQDTTQDVPHDAPAAVQTSSALPSPANGQPSETPTPALQPSHINKPSAEPTSNQASPSSDNLDVDRTNGQHVQTLFETEPAGVEVFRGEKRISEETTPFKLAIPRESVAGKYVFKKRGFNSVQKTIEPPGEGPTLTIKATLKPAKKTRKKTRASNPLRRRTR